MQLTKTQVAGLCLLLGAVPALHQWHALTQAQASQAVWEKRWTQAEAEIRATQAFLSARPGPAPTPATPRPLPAKTVAQSPAPLWNEAVSFVAVPKSLWPSLSFAGYTKDYNLTPEMKDALALTPEETSQTESLLQDFARQITARELGAIQRTNALPPGLSVQSPHGEPIQFYLLPAFPEEGRQWRDALQANLRQALGQERADLFWEKSEGRLRNDNAEFGAVDRYLYFLPTGQAEVVEFGTAFLQDLYFGSIVSGPRRREEIPQKYHSLLDDWKESSTAATPAPASTINPAPRP